MDNKKIIRLSSKALQFFKWVYLISFTAFLALLFLWFLNRELFENVILTSGFEAGVGSLNIKFNENEIESLRGVSVYSLSPTLMIWLFIRTAVFFAFGWMIIRQIEKIIKSIVSIEIFYKSNVGSFQRIAIICIYITVFSSFNMFWNEKSFDLDFTIPFFPLLASISCYLLAVIFEEGMKLSEENKTIV